MELDEVRLCPFCVELIKRQPKSPGATLPLQLHHHSTFGALVSSGETCGLCHFISSLWEFREDDLTRFGSKADPGTKELFKSVIQLKENLEMGSGVEWTMLEANFEHNKNPVTFSTKFTLVTCGAQGNNFPLIQ
jgi:hypothetical protein